MMTLPLHCTYSAYDARGPCTADSAAERTSCSYSVTACGCCPDQAAAGSDAEVAYARLEALCAAIRAELEVDLRIHDAALLPKFVNLPAVTAAEYGRVGPCPLLPLWPCGDMGHPTCLQTLPAPRVSCDMRACSHVTWLYCLCQSPSP